MKRLLAGVTVAGLVALTPAVAGAEQRRELVPAVPELGIPPITMASFCITIKELNINICF